MKLLIFLKRLFCRIFGHHGEEKIIPGTQICEDTRFDALIEDGICIGGNEKKVYSNEYEFKCARCGFTRRERR